LFFLSVRNELTGASYWDSEFEPENYSYVHAALKAGYSIFTYDRIGTGDSDKPDAYTVVTLPTQVEVLKELSLLVRRGELTKIAKTHMQPEVVPTFQKIVHVGHSYGSITTATMLGVHDGLDLSDGALLTGFVFSNVTMSYGQWGWGWQFATENDPVKYRDYGSGYLVVGTESSLQQAFFSNQGFLDPKALAYANQIKAPTAVGEFLSAGSLAGTPAPSFKGPILVSHVLVIL
jgi:pimeloyl-ACP methyl ester carboxylesterase